MLQISETTSKTKKSAGIVDLLWNNTGLLSDLYILFHGLFHDSPLFCCHHMQNSSSEVPRKLWGRCSTRSCRSPVHRADKFQSHRALVLLYSDLKNHNTYYINETHSNNFNEIEAWENFKVLHWPIRDYEKTATTYR